MTNFELITAMEELLNEAVPRAQHLYRCGKSSDGTIRLESSMQIDPETDEYVRTYYVTVITQERTKNHFESLEDAHAFVVGYHKTIMNTTQEEANNSDMLTGIGRDLNKITELKLICSKDGTLLVPSLDDNFDYVVTCPQCNSKKIANHLV